MRTEGHRVPVSLRQPRRTAYLSSFYHAETLGKAGFPNPHMGERSREAEVGRGFLPSPARSVRFCLLGPGFPGSGQRTVNSLRGWVCPSSQAGPMRGAVPGFTLGLHPGGAAVLWVLDSQGAGAAF